MTTADLLADAFERIRDAVHPAVNGLSAEELALRPGEQSNSIAWLVWHLTRIQDDHVAAVAAVAAVGAALGDVFFASEGDAAVSAVAGFYLNDGFIDEHGRHSRFWISAAIKRRES